MMHPRVALSIFIIAAFTFAFCHGSADAQNTKKGDLILATTTSTVDSGLLDDLVPKFEKETGYRVKTISVGTGQALAMGARGEADVLLTHAPEAEKKLVDSGVVVDYTLVMHNDFVIVGPPNDPAEIRGKASSEAFQRIMKTNSIFVSRGDDSGTHKNELFIWKAAGITPGELKGYQESGQGMGSTVQMASEKQGYTLTDRATFLALKDKLNLHILSEGDKGLLNIYHVTRVNPDKFSKVNAEGGKAFIKFMIAPETQRAIGELGKDKYGQPLFFPDAGKQL